MGNTRMEQHPQHVKRYLERLYGSGRRRYECRAGTRREFDGWQRAARRAFRRLLRLPVIAAECEGQGARVEISSEKEDQISCFRQQAWIETEPDVRIQFWMFTPKGRGPFPLAVTPHGHGSGELEAGIARDAQAREQMEQEDRDVAVQAARRGFLAIAPATRGIGQNASSFRVADIANRHGGSDCRCHSWQVLMAGRTMLGERVWDLTRLLDWALALPEVDGDTVLMLGNSGGGMAALHTAAADERVTIVVPCCAYSNYVSPFGTLRHCSCNAVPGIMEFGEFWDVAGLVAPRRMLTVAGDLDVLHPVDEVTYAVSRLRKIYQAAGAEDCYEHRFGRGGHRFYGDLMWPWIEGTLRDLAATGRS